MTPDKPKEKPNKKTVIASRPSTGGKGSAEARRLAGLVLQVLAGTVLPSDAAKTLGVSLPRYYMLEGRALEGLVAGCEPRKRGYVLSAEKELEVLRRERARLERQCARYQALVRGANKTMGLALPRKETEAAKGVKGKRKRKPVVRALRAAQRLKAQPESAGASMTVSNEEAKNPAKGA